MKKLMFAIAAIAAGAAMADVTSANIVGYMSKVTNPGTDTGPKRHMLTPTFQQIGEEGMYMSEIKITGYQESSYFQDAGNAPAVTMAKLSTGGSTLVTYQWVDTCINGVWAGGYWVNKENEIQIGTGDEPDPLLIAGESYWTATPRAKREGCNGLNFMFNGQVLQESQQVCLNDASGTGPQRHGVGNMMPVDVGLTELSIVGYQESSYFMDAGNAPAVTAAKLSTGGSTLVTYQWVDTYNSQDKKWAGGYWINKENEKIIVTEVKDENTEELEPTLTPGEAYWVACPRAKREGCKGVWMRFPKKVD